MNKEKAEKTEDKETVMWKDKLTDKLNQFKKTRWFPLAVALLIIGAGIVFALLLGFRITYAPALENSWGAVSGVAEWFGVFASVASAIASFMAVRYAIRVADKQNQITLFEKRFEIYVLYADCRTFAKKLDYSIPRRDVYKKFMESFYLEETFGVSDEKLYDIDPVMIIKRGFNINEQMLSAIFLFDKEIGLRMANVAGKMSDVILMKYDEDNEEERNLIIQAFKDAARDDEDLTDKIETILSLK